METSDSDNGDRQLDTSSGSFNAAAWNGDHEQSRLLPGSAAIRERSATIGR